VTVRVFPGEAPPTFVLAHGAGTNQRHRTIVALAEALTAHGRRVVTFDYPYSEAGRRAPDRPPKLLACHEAVVEWARGRWGEPLVLAGRSMGGRMATMLVASGVQAAAVVLYAYPLHPAGRPDRLRIDHLPEVGVPMLFFQGTRDALSRTDLFDLHVRPLAGTSVVDIAGADHSFRGRGLDPAALTALLAAETVAWADRELA
jgi:hypothetical protein